MDGLNENSNEQQAQQPVVCLHRFSKTIKVFIIGGSVSYTHLPETVDSAQANESISQPCHAGIGKLGCIDQRQSVE